MKNLLKEEFYKSNKGITQYLCFGIALFMALAVAVLYIVISDGYDWITFQTDMPWSISIPAHVAVFVMVYICNEFSRGTVKNYISLGFSRNKVFWAKYIKILVITFVLLFACQLLTLTFTPFVLKAEIVNFWPNALYYAYALLAILEYVSFFVAIGFITKSVGAIIGIYFGLSVFVGVIDGIKIFGNFPVIEFLSKFFDYAYIGKQVNLGEKIFIVGGTMPEMVLAIIVPIIVSGISIFGGMYFFNKSDIK